jgi:hypothetical protein
VSYAAVVAQALKARSCVVTGAQYGATQQLCLHVELLRLCYLALIYCPRACVSMHLCVCHCEPPVMERLTVRACATT